MTILPVPTPTPLPDVPASEPAPVYRDVVLEYQGTLQVNLKKHFMQPFLNETDPSKKYPQFLTGANSGYSGLYGTYCSVPTWQKTANGIKAGPFRGFQLWGGGIQDIDFMGNYAGPFNTNTDDAYNNNATRYPTADNYINMSQARASCCFGFLDLNEGIYNSYASQVYKEFYYFGFGDVKGNSKWLSALNTRPDMTGDAYIPDSGNPQSDFGVNYGGIIFDDTGLIGFMGYPVNYLYWPNGPLGCDNAWGEGNRSMLGTYYAAGTILGRYHCDGSRFWTPNLISHGGAAGICTSSDGDPNYNTLVNPVTGRYLCARQDIPAANAWDDVLVTGSVFRDIEFLSYPNADTNPMIEPRPGNFIGKQEDLLSFSEKFDQDNFGKNGANEWAKRIIMTPGGGYVVYTFNRFGDINVTKNALYIAPDMKRYWRLEINVPSGVSLFSTDSFMFSNISGNFGVSVDGIFFYIDNNTGTLYSNFGELILNLPEIVTVPYASAIDCRAASCFPWEG